MRDQGSSGLRSIPGRRGLQWEDLVLAGKRFCGTVAPSDAFEKSRTTAERLVGPRPRFLRALHCLVLFVHERDAMCRRGNSVPWRNHPGKVVRELCQQPVRSPDGEPEFLRRADSVMGPRPSDSRNLHLLSPDDRLQRPQCRREQTRGLASVGENTTIS